MRCSLKLVFHLFSLWFLLNSPWPCSTSTLSYLTCCNPNIMTFLWHGGFIKPLRWWSSPTGFCSYADSSDLLLRAMCVCPDGTPFVTLKRCRWILGQVAIYDLRSLLFPTHPTTFCCFAVLCFSSRLSTVAIIKGVTFSLAAQVSVSCCTCWLTGSVVAYRDTWMEPSLMLFTPVLFRWRAAKLFPVKTWLWYWTFLYRCGCYGG